MASVKHLALLGASLLGQAVAQNSTAAFDPLMYVDTLIGTANGGDVFPGATLPNGLAKAVADSTDGGDQGGFVSDGATINGFSSLHDSGTGGEPSLGNFALFPFANAPTPDSATFNKNQRAVGYDNTSVVASPGFFGITLNNGIRTEMTTTMKTALYRFSWGPQGNSGTPMIIMDLTDLSNSRQDNASITVDSKTGRMKGNGIFLPSFGSGNYSAYFCADFTGAKMLDNGVFVNSRASKDLHSVQVSRGINGFPLPAGGFIRFDKPGNTNVTARVGISFKSEDQACSNAQSEIPSYDFAGVQAAAVTAWRQKLSPITVSTTGINHSMLVNFFSSQYRTHISPQNYTGENPLWVSNEPYFDSFYCIWDLFRSTMPFLTIVDPVTVSQMLRSLIDTYVHSGWLPDCRMSFCKGYTQGGSNADVLIADAYVKNLTNGINYQTAYAALIKDAEVEPYDWSVEGRGGLDSWKSLGYIPVQDFDYKGFGTYTRSVSRTLEYAYNDFCVYEVGKAMGATNSSIYQGRSENWKNLFKANQTSDLLNSTQSTGFTGFFQPKYNNMTWGYQNPLMCSNIDNSGAACSLQADGAETFESSLWEFFVPHDQAALISAYGGAQSYVNRLNYLHDNQITYIGNEPAFLTVFQYHYAGRPGLSASRSHYYIPAYFQPTDGGLPGNDDSGTMGAFVTLAMIGLFPNPGQNVYLITPPYFEQVQIKSPQTGKTATIKNVNFDPSYKNIYIQNATLNGKPYTKNWIDHSFFLEGKELVLYLGSSESTWGTHIADLPPSLSKYNSTSSPLNSTRSSHLQSHFDAAHRNHGFHAEWTSAA